MRILAIPKKKRIYAIAFTPSGRDLAAACGDGKVRVWDTTTGEVRHIQSPEETSSGYALCYLSEHELLVADRNLLHWDLSANEWTSVIPGMGWGRQLLVSPDGTLLAQVDASTSTDWPGTGLVVTDPSSWLSSPQLGDAYFTSGGLAFIPDGKLLATSHIVRVGEKQRSLGPQWGHFTINDYDYVVRIREMPECRTVQTIAGWGQGVRFLAFSPDGKTLAGTAGPRLRVWDLENDRELAIQKRGTKHFQGLAFTLDGRRLLTVSNDSTVRVWDALTWNEASTFEWDIGRLLNIAIAPDGLRAAAGSDKGKIVIWDLEE